MRDEDILAGTLIEEAWLTLDQIAAACSVERDWIATRIGEGFLPEAEGLAGTWRFTSASVLRAQRMRALERDFDAVPELAALFADLLEEIDSLRMRLRGSRSE